MVFFLCNRKIWDFDRYLEAVVVEGCEVERDNSPCETSLFLFVIHFPVGFPPFKWGRWSPDDFDAITCGSHIGWEAPLSYSFCTKANVTSRWVSVQQRQIAAVTGPPGDVHRSTSFSLHRGGVLQHCLTGIVMFHDIIFPPADDRGPPVPG